jgi:hypothetical protein
VRYRVTVAQVIDGVATMVMDATGAGFHAARVSWMAIACSPSTASAVTLTCASLAELIAHHPTGPHRRTQ